MKKFSHVAYQSPNGYIKIFAAYLDIHLMVRHHILAINWWLTCVPRHVLPLESAPYLLDFAG